MNELLQHLIKLQSLETGGTDSKSVAASKLELRGKIPPQILAHYDRLVARGKKGLAAVSANRVCSACHMQVPIGAIMTLRHGDDIQLCGSCGRYLYLPPAAEPEAAEPPAAPKPAKKTRKPRKTAKAA
jgi:predicted  nucleic acid-binding Zn-ribbon protein